MKLTREVENKLYSVYDATYRTLSVIPRADKYLFPVTRTNNLARHHAIDRSTISKILFFNVCSLSLSVNNVTVADFYFKIYQSPVIGPVPHRCGKA